MQPAYRTEGVKPGWPGGMDHCDSREGSKLSLLRRMLLKRDIKSYERYFDSSDCPGGCLCKNWLGVTVLTSNMLSSDLRWACSTFE